MSEKDGALCGCGEPSPGKRGCRSATPPAPQDDAGPYSFETAEVLHQEPRKVETCDYCGKTGCAYSDVAVHPPLHPAPPPPDDAERKDDQVKVLDIKPRVCVERFARQMEQKLQVHDDDRGRRGWIGFDPRDLVRRILDETAELLSTIERQAAGDGTLRREVVSEAVDVANFAMMIADIYRDPHKESVLDECDE